MIAYILQAFLASIGDDGGSAANQQDDVVKQLREQLKELRLSGNV